MADEDGDVGEGDGDGDGDGNGDRYGPGRVIGLTDGVVAIAMTLLALDLKPDLPTNASSEDLLHWFGDHSGQYIAFFIAFAVSAQYWVVHHRIMRQVARNDDGLLWANMFFLFTVTLLPLSTYILGAYGGSLSETVFAANLLLGSVSISLLYRLIHRHHLTDRPDPDVVRRMGNWRSVTTTAVPIVVGTLAWIIPHYASFFFFLFFATDLPGRLVKRRHDRAAAAA